MNTTPPTPELALAFQGLYDYFNHELFDDQLAPCVLNFSRHARSAGFFAPARWARADMIESTGAMAPSLSSERVIHHEISINPSYMAVKGPTDVAQTLVHEMCHLWQHEHGRPSRPGYHNQEWAAKMEAVGLMPSSTGKPGGDKTGQKMADYPIEGGRFETAFKAIPKDRWFPWICRPEADKDEEKKRKKKAQSKTKYGCPGCDLNVWGRPGLQIRCEDCDEILEEESV